MTWVSGRWTTPQICLVTWQLVQPHSSHLTSSLLLPYLFTLIHVTSSFLFFRPFEMDHAQRPSLFRIHDINLVLSISGYIVFFRRPCPWSWRDFLCTHIAHTTAMLTRHHCANSILKRILHSIYYIHDGPTHFNFSKHTRLCTLCFFYFFLPVT